jgi:TonB family protein
MIEPATAVIVDRARHPGGLGRMVSVSVAAHGALIAALAFAGLMSSRADRNRDRMVMTISLGGAPGPKTGGMTSIGGRPIQEQTPADLKRPEPARPPAAKAPEMAVPLPGAKPVKPTQGAKQAPEEAKGRTPTRGEEARPGSTPAETGAKGSGFGLSMGGGGGGGYLDVANFCCPEYIQTMIDLINRNWQSRQGVAGSTLMKFTIQRDGTLVNIETEKTSGYAVLDMQAQRALMNTQKIPPLPSAFSGDSLTVHLYFDYQR